MKHCQQCNMDFPDAYRFCGSCGGGLSDSIRCPGCGELAEARFAFCTSCGGQLLSNKTGDQFLPAAAPEPALISAGSPSSFSMPVAAISQTPTMHAFEQTKHSALHEWYAAPDLFEEETQTPAAPILRQELVPTAMVAAPQVAALPQAGNGKPHVGNGKAPPT